MEWSGQGCYTAPTCSGPGDWYDDGAGWLIEHQTDNGSWRNVTDTCFAILFLKRATAPLPGVASVGRPMERYGLFFFREAGFEG